MGEVSEKYMQECESLKCQIKQKDKAYVVLMDQFNKLQAEKNGLQELIAGQADDINTLRERLESKTNVINSINGQNADYIIAIQNWERKASEYEQKIDSLQEQCSIRYESIERLNGEKKQLEEVIKDRTKDVQHYDEENKKLLQKLDAAEKALEDANRTEHGISNDLELFASANAQLREKNERIISAVADLFKRIMEE